MNLSSRVAPIALAAVLGGCWPQVCVVHSVEGASYCEERLDSILCYIDLFPEEDEGPIDEGGCSDCPDSRSFTSCESEGYRYQCEDRWYRSPCLEEASAAACATAQPRPRP